MLTSADWNTFNNKLISTLANTNIFVGNASNVATAVALTLNATGGTFGLANTGVLTMPNANTSTRGLLTSADWNTFNNKSTIADWASGFGSGTQATSTWTATNAAANVNAAITPKGTGALLVDIPDATITGGNARGAYAVDLQHSRSAASQVASGSYSVISGGQDNQAGGTASFIGGGFSNYGFNNYFVICGGYDNTNGGASAFVGGGQSNNLSSGSFAVLVGGDTNYISGNYSFLGGGYQNQINEQFASVVGGRNANANLYGMQAYSAGSFAALADAQMGTIQMRRAITGTAIAELFLDGSSVKAILPATNAAWMARIQFVAICTAQGNGTTTTGGVYVREYTVGIKRIGTATSLVGAVQNVVVDQHDGGMATSVVTITADDVNEALKIEFTPPTTAGTTTTFRAVATIQLTQVKY